MKADQLPFRLIQSRRDSVWGEDMFDHLKDSVDWWQYELKVREFYDKRYFEYMKLSAEFAKIIVANLAIINAGGLVSIPAMNSLINGTKIGHAASYWPSVVSFIAGLVLALLCGFATYMNYQYWAHSAENRGLEHLAAAQSFHPAADSNDDYKKAAEDMKSSRGRYAATAEKRISVTFNLAQAFGWLSALAFIIGAVQLIRIAIYA